MIQVKGSTIQDFCTILRKGLGICNRRRGPVVHVSSDEKCLRIRAITDEIAIEWATAGNFLPEGFSAPLDLLREYRGSRTSNVDWKLDGEKIDSHWLDAGVHKSLTFQAISQDSTFPETPVHWVENEGRLVAALSIAADTVDQRSTEFALSYVCLRGQDGQVVATDGRQAIAESGFQFPWNEQCLVPLRRLLTCQKFLDGEKVHVGKLADWVVIRSGHWTVWLRINRRSRYPELDFLLRRPASVVAVLQIGESDAKFLQRNLKNLPSSESFNGPVTIDMNDQIALRAENARSSSVTELILANSRRSGAEVCLVSDRTFLDRAIRLGFREFLVAGEEAPVVCVSKDRVMVWALLGSDAAIRSSSWAAKTSLVSDIHFSKPFYLGSLSRSTIKH